MRSFKMFRMRKNLYKLLRFFSIKKRLRIVYFVQIFLVAFWCALAIYSSVNNTISYIQLNNSQMVLSMKETLRTSLASLKIATKYPVVRTEDQANNTYKYLAAPWKYHSYILDLDFKNNTNNLFEQHPSLSSIYIFDLNGDGTYLTSIVRNVYLRQGGDFGNPASNQKQSDWYKETLSERGKEFVWSGTEITHLEEQDKIGDVSYENKIFLSRSIFNTEIFLNVGVIVACSDLNPVLDSFAQRKYLPEESIGIFTLDGRELMGTLTQDDFEILSKHLEQNPQQSGSSYINGSFYTFASVDDYLCAVKTPALPLIKVSIQQQRLFFIMILILLLFTSISMNIIVTSITNPIAKLVKSCEYMREYKQLFHFSDDARDELAEFTSSFNHLTSEIEQLVTEGYKKDLAMAETELQMLRQQINPHFLYNTLESMRAAAKAKGQEELGEMAFLLAKTLRYGVAPANDLVPLERELLYLEDYIRLQDMRYGGAISFHISVSRELYSKTVLRLFLQPIVENAIYHGMSSRTQGGLISILGFEDRGNLVFQVTDNGEGISPDEVKDLNAYINGENELFRSIGMKNVHRRIQLFFGTDYGVEIESRMGRGTIVTIRLPMDDLEQEAKIVPDTVG